MFATTAYIIVFISCNACALPFYNKTEYAIIFEKFEIVAQNPKNMELFSFKMSKYNRTTTVMNGLFRFVKNVTKSVQIDIIGYEQHGVEYRKSIVDMRNIIYCDYVSDSTTATSGFLQFTNITHTTCPIPAGMYSLTNYILDRLHYRLIFTGHKWRSDFILHENGDLWSHSRIYFKVENQ